jgi:type VI secretion system protein ImpL
MEILNSFFSRVGDYFAKLSTLPTLILILIFLGILIIIITIIMVIISARQGAKKKAEEQKSPLIADDPDAKTETEIKRRNNNLPPLGGPVSEFLVKRGYFQVSDLSKSFFSALDFLRSSLNSPNYKYRLPWYLLIGSEESGKTSLMEGSNLNLPVGAPSFGEQAQKADCRWWFLNRGVILDIKGKFLINARGTGSNENGWRSLLILLSRYRAARPLNGILLTISAEELYGKYRLSVEEISERASFLAHKLQAAQNNMGLRLPVYVIVTKCDTIPGFQSICAEIPNQNRQNMFGWSSPYNPTISFSLKWIEEAFSSVNDFLNNLRMDILASNRPHETRDGIFVFPAELATIKERLSIYISSIFKTEAYQETPLLRGLYFVGDSGVEGLSTFDMNVINENQEAPLKINDPTRDMLAPDRRKIFFIDDLINEKVFYEAGLSKPLSGRILSINRGINIAKISTALFAVIGSIGLYNAYERFLEQRTYMMPVLQKMNTLLYEMQKIQINQPSQSTLVFEAYAREFMDMMDRMQNASFFSVFVPASWFSPIRRDMNETLKISYQQIIIKSIYIDLIIKARTLLNLKPGQQDTSESLAVLLKPLAGKEWSLVKTYVNDLAKLEEMIFKFNNLRSASDPRDLDDLVAFTFNSRLPQQFVENYKSIRSLLENMPFPNIDLAPYQFMARETLGVLYQNYLNAMFNVENSKSLPGRVNDILSKLSNSQNKRAPDIKSFRQFSLELTEGVRCIGDAGQTWMDAEYFNPGKEYDDLFDALDANERLFGKKVSQFLIDQTAIGFENFKQQLKTLNLTLVGFKARMPLAPIQKQKIDTKYSQGILDLANALSELFNEPYMCEATGARPDFNVPSGKMLRWDANMIDVAFEMAKSFDDFLGKHVENFPKMIQENLRIMARESLQANIVDLVARAQNFVSEPTTMVDRLQAEEILASQIKDIQTVAPKFVKLLQLMNQGTVGFSFTELRNLLGNSYFWMLSQVEKLQGTLSPFSVKDKSFNWWDGKVNAALNGFAVRDQQDLQSYMDVQRAQMKRLVGYAEPIVLFLNAPIMMEVQGDKTLLNRWVRICEQYKAAEAKQAGSSYSQLEEFILKTMNTFTAENVPSLIPINDIKQQSGDYFLELTRSLKKGLLERAEVLKRQVGVSNYEKLIKIFNDKIRNKFPFVIDINTAKDEVAPEDLKEFFDAYDKFGGSPDKILDQVYQLGASASSMISFLENMNRVRAFLEPYLLGKADGDTISLDVKVDFRVNRDKESGADKVAEGFIQLGDTKVDKQNKSGRWYLGQPVIIGFRYVDGDTKPVADSNQQSYRADGSTASFVFTGRWALIKAIKTLNASELTADNRFYVLGFSIPNTQGKTSLYNRITLSVPALKAKAAGKTMRIPEFPVDAPAVSQDVKGYMNQAPLADGLIEPQIYKPKEFDEGSQSIPDVGSADFAASNTSASSPSGTVNPSSSASTSVMGASPSSTPSAPSASVMGGASPSSMPSAPSASVMGASQQPVMSTSPSAPSPTPVDAIIQGKEEIGKLFSAFGAGPSNTNGSPSSSSTNGAISSGPSPSDGSSPSSSSDSLSNLASSITG